MGKNQLTLKLGDHTFGLSDFREGIHSEETIDFMARLTCDGESIATVSNNGHGGSTDYYPYPGVDMQRYWTICEEVSGHVWLTCQDGTEIHHNLGTIADEILIRHEDLLFG